MEWWQTLLVAVVSPAVTAVALIWQTRANNDRDDQRRAAEAEEREREREAASAERAEARKHSIRDHWREERKVAHTTLLAELNAATDDLSRRASSISPASDPTMLTETIPQMREHLAAVQLLSLPATRHSAESAFQHVQRLNFAVMATRFAEDEEAKSKRRETAVGVVESTRSAVGAYLDAVRTELDTEEG